MSMKDNSAAKNTLDKVSEEFLREILSDIDDGKRQASAHIESVEKETRESIKKIIEGSIRQADTLRRQIISTAELESRNAQLRALEEIVNDVFTMAMDNLSKLDRGRYESALERLIKEGISIIGKSAVVACNARDRKIVSSIIKRLNGGQVKISLDDKQIETIGGVILTSEDGTVRFDNTFEARLERFKPMLRKEIAAILS